MRRSDGARDVIARAMVLTELSGVAGDGVTSADAADAAHEDHRLAEPMTVRERLRPRRDVLRVGASRSMLAARSGDPIEHARRRCSSPGCTTAAAHAIVGSCRSSRRLRWIAASPNISLKIDWVRASRWVRTWRRLARRASAWSRIAAMRRCSGRGGSGIASHRTRQAVCDRESMVAPRTTCCEYRTLVGRS